MPPTPSRGISEICCFVWRENQSFQFTGKNTSLSKAGNAYLRYCLLNVTCHIKNHRSKFATLYQKKYAEMKAHQHKISLTLTARKLVRLIFGLLAKLNAKQTYFSRLSEIFIKYTFLWIFIQIFVLSS